MTSALHQQVRRTIRRHALLPQGARVLVGLSGGSDSVALTLLLHELAPTSGFTLAGVAHFDHQLRPTAARDAVFCRELAEALGLPIVFEATPVAVRAAELRLSIEDAARRLRYGFLARAAASLGAGYVAVGHTRDDQAETFLLKLMRGAGGAGLGGVYPRKGDVVRPLLEVGRRELRDFLGSRGQSWVEDESNAQLDNPRNRLRHVVLPEIDRIAGGNTRASFARAADLVREDAELLDRLAAERFVALATFGDRRVELPVEALAAEPLPLRRRIVRLALLRLAGGREIGLGHVEAAVELAAAGGGGIDLPGSRMELRRGKLVLIGQGDAEGVPK